MIKNISVLDKEFQIVLHDHEELVSDIIREKGIYSRNDLIIMKDLLKEGDIFFDIGTNIGWHTFFGSTLVGDSGKVISFEPVSDNFNLLQQGLKLNGFKNVVLNKAAISNKNCKKEICISPTNFGDNILIKKKNLYKFANHYDMSEKVECVKLDDYLNDINIDKIKLIKIDAQGSEADALEGMKKLIQKHKPYFIIEYSPNHLKLCDSSPFDILSFVDKNNYILYHLREELNLSANEILNRPRLNELVKTTEEIILSEQLVGFDLFLVPMQT